MPIDNNRPTYVKYVSSPSFTENEAKLTRELIDIINEADELLKEGWQYAEALVHGSFKMPEAIRADGLVRIDYASQALSEYINEIKGRLANTTEQIPAHLLMRLVPSGRRDFFVALPDRLEMLDDTATSATKALHPYFPSDENVSVTEAKSETSSKSTGDGIP